MSNAQENSHSGDPNLEIVEVDGYEQEEDDDSGSAWDDELKGNDHKSSPASSEMNSGERDHQKTEGIMVELNEQFGKMEELFFSEQESLVDLRLEQLEGGIYPEYLSSLEKLKENRNHPTHVADVLLELRRQAIEEVSKFPVPAWLSNIQDLHEVVYNELKQDLAKKIKRLKKDRTKADSVPEGLECHNDKGNEQFHPINSERKKKPGLNSRVPFAYRLNDNDRIADVTILNWLAEQKDEQRRYEALARIFPEDMQQPQSRRMALPRM